MSVRKLDKSTWQAFFNSLSRVLQGARAEVDAMSLSIGSQVEADWLPLNGLTYDAKDDILEVAMDGLDHLIRQPDDIFIDEESGMLSSLEVVGRDKVSQIVKLKEPVRMPV
jgi:hypothetical protein